MIKNKFPYCSLKLAYHAINLINIIAKFQLFEIYLIDLFRLFIRKLFYLSLLEWFIILFCWTRTGLLCFKRNFWYISLWAFFISFSFEKIFLYWFIIITIYWIIFTCITWILITVITILFIIIISTAIAIIILIKLQDFIFLI